MKYSYIIYKIYSWTANKKGDTPIVNTILTLGIVHFSQLAAILVFVDRVITPLKWLDYNNKTFIYIGAIIYFILLYFLLYNKDRWNSYVKKYSNESERQRKRGNLWVIAYIGGSILLFFISLPVSFSIGRK